MKFAKITHNPLYDIILLGVFISLLFGALLGGRPYSAPSESRYVEIGREMAESGNYVTPRLDYVKYFEKPPLFYWVQAAWTKAMGTGFLVSRVPNAFFTVVLCLLTYSLGRMLYGRSAGVLSALVMATSLYVFALSRVVLLDVLVSVFLVATLTAFLYAVRSPPGKMRSLVLYGMYVAAAGAVMTKGLIGFLLPGAIIFLWFACTGRWALLKDMKILSGTILFLLIAVPWHIIVWQHNPEHPQFYFIHEHWQRYTSKVHGRYQPFWFFGAVLVAGLFPWITFSYQGARASLSTMWSERKTDGTPLFLALWIGFILLFFSASDSKLIPYILPIFPPIAVMIGGYFALVWQEQPVPGFAKKSAGFTSGVTFMILLLVIMAAAPLIAANIFDADSKVAVALVQAGDDLVRLSAASLVGAIALFVAMIQARRRHVIILLLLMAAVIAQLGDMIAASYNKDSMQGFAQIIKQFGGPGDEVVSYDNYYQDLPLYLGKRVTIVDWWLTDKSELKFGAEHEDTSAWMIEYPEFWKRWMTPGHTMFVVMRDEAYARIKAEKNIKDEVKDTQALHLYLLQQEGRNMLFANTSPEILTQKKPSK